MREDSAAEGRSGEARSNHDNDQAGGRSGEARSIHDNDQVASTVHVVDMYAMYGDGWESPKAFPSASLFFSKQPRCNPLFGSHGRQKATTTTTTTPQGSATTTSTKHEDEGARKRDDDEHDARGRRRKEDKATHRGWTSMVDITSVTLYRKRDEAVRSNLSSHGNVSDVDMTTTTS
jgi:hypothetical protein